MGYNTLYLSFFAWLMHADLQFSHPKFNWSQACHNFFMLVSTGFIPVALESSLGARA
jgi:hypothetical protein